MTIFYVSVAGGGSGQSPGSRMTMAEANAAVGPGDRVLVENGTYNTIPFPDVDGEDGNLIYYICEHGTPSTNVETARGVVIECGSNSMFMRQEYVSWEGFDLDSQRSLGAVFYEAVNPCSNWVWSHVRSIRAWYNENALLRSHNNSLGSHDLLFDNCWFWGPAKTDNASDIVKTREGESEPYNVHFNGGGMIWNQHTMMSLGGSVNNPDYAQVLANRVTYHDILIRNFTMRGGDHTLAIKDAGYNIWVDHVDIDLVSSGDGGWTNTTNNYNNNVYAGSGYEHDDDSDGVRIWCWTTGGAITFCNVLESGSNLANDRNGCMSVVSEGNGQGGPNDLRRIETPPLFAHVTVTKGFSSGIILVNKDNTGGNEIFAAPILVNCILFDNNHDGDFGDSSENAPAEIRLFQGTAASGLETDVGSGIWGSVISGQSIGQDVVNWDGTSLALTEAKNNAFVPKDEFDIDTSNQDIDPDFVDVDNRDLRPQDSTVAAMGTYIAIMEDSGTSATSGRVRHRKVALNGAGWFWQANQWKELDQSGRSLGDSTPATLTTAEGRKFWMKTTGGTVYGPLETQTADYYVASGDNLTWDTPVTYDVGTEIYLTDPSESVYAGAYAAPGGGGEDPGTPPETTYTPKVLLAISGS